MPEPICKIAQENGGHVPLDCLFHCPRGCKSKNVAPVPVKPQSTRNTLFAPPICKYCNTPIEWIHSGVRWRPYEIGAKKLHACNRPVDPSEFQPIKD